MKTIIFLLLIATSSYGAELSNAQKKQARTAASDLRKILREHKAEYDALAGNSDIPAQEALLKDAIPAVRKVVAVAGEDCPENLEWLSRASVAWNRAGIKRMAHLLVVLSMQ